MGFLKLFGNKIGTKSILVTSILFIFLSLVFSFNSAFRTPDEDRPVLAAGRFIQQHTQPSDLIVASHGTNMNLLYYSRRRGWAFRLIDRENIFLEYKKFDQKMTPDSAEHNQFLSHYDDPVEMLKLYQSLGARYFVCTRTADFQHDEKTQSFKTYLDTQCHLIFENPGQFVVYELVNS